MSGSGSLAKSGAGTLMLGGTNSYSGGTTVSAGILQGTTGSLQGNILNNATVIFEQTTDRHLCRRHVGQRQPDQERHRHGDPDRRQQLQRRHDGVRRRPAGQQHSLQGNILNNATVVFNQTGNGTYAGSMSGTGGMVLQGGGMLALTGINTYTGPTTVTGSTLYVNGTLASAVTIDSASVLRGTGTIGGFVSNGGTCRPATRSAR